MPMNRKTRREFLKYGAGLMTLPLLPSLLPKALAQTSETTKRPIRVIFINHTNGQRDDYYWPDDSQTMTQFAPHIYYKKLSEISGDISRLFTSGFDPYRNKMSLIRGLDIFTSNQDHNRGAFLTAVGNRGDASTSGSPPPFGASIDWIMEQSTRFYQLEPKARAIRFNGPEWLWFSFSNVNGSVKDLSYLDSDSGVFNQLFDSGSTTAPSVDQNAKRRLAADTVMQRLSTLRSNARLSSFDKQRLNDHIDMVNKLKATYVTSPIAQNCNKPTISLYQSGDYKKIYENLNDIIVTSFSCDLTRIASINLADGSSTKRDFQHWHDSVSHGTSKAYMEEMLVLNKWRAERVIDLLAKLDSVTESDGSTLLDNTMVLWGNQVGTTPYFTGGGHFMMSFPLAFFGGKNIPFNFGHYVDYRHRPFLKIDPNRSDFPYYGRPYNQFLASIMLAAGLQRSEFEIYGQNGKFGEFKKNTAFGYTNPLYNTYLNTYTDPLPFLYKGTNV